MATNKRNAACPLSIRPLLVPAGDALPVRNGRGLAVLIVTASETAVCQLLARLLRAGAS